MSGNRLAVFAAASLGFGLFTLGFAVATLIARTFNVC